MLSRPKPLEAVAVLPYLDQVQLIRRRIAPFSGKYSIITGHLEPRHAKWAQALDETFEELFSTYPSLYSGLSRQLKRELSLESVFTVVDSTTNFRLFVYRLQLHNSSFIPYDDEVIEIRGHREISPSEMNPLSQFVLSRVGLVTPQDTIRYRHTKRGYIIDYDHPNTASISF
jgi:8-oxo-dGTP pyrophosphatase MutT (NUDIX family)